MKKIILLLFAVVQLTITYAQSKKDWSQWQTAKCFRGIQFRTRPIGNNPEDFNVYIQFRNNYYKKVAFSYVVKVGSEEVDNYIKKYGDQYRKEIEANSTDDGLMWLSLKKAGTPYLAVGYLRFLTEDGEDTSQPFEGCDDRIMDVCLLCKLKPRPDCNNYDKKNEPKNLVTENKPSAPRQSVKALEESIIANLRANLKSGSFFNPIQKFDETMGSIQVDRNAMIYSDSAEPHTVYIMFRLHPSTFLFSSLFADLKIEKLSDNGRPLLHFKQKYDYNPPPLVHFISATFLYDFGPNDENFIALLNAVKALKNLAADQPVTPTEDPVVTTSTDTNNEEPDNRPLFKLQRSLNADTKNYDEIKQNILDYFNEQNLTVLSSRIVSNGTVHYFDTEPKLYLLENAAERRFTIAFQGKYIKMGEEFAELTKSNITLGHLFGDYEYSLTFTLDRAIKIELTSPDFQITSPENHAVINIYPRVTNVSWTPMAGATSYELHVECTQGPGSGDFTTAGNFFRTGTYLINSPNYTFNGGGSQVHRYRVLAKKNGKLIAETDWNLINYSR